MKVYSTTVYYGDGKRDTTFADSPEELIARVETKRDSSIVLAQIMLIATAICVFAWVLALRMLFGSEQNLAVISFGSAIMLALGAWPSLREISQHTFELNNALDTLRKTECSETKAKVMRPIWSDKEWDS